MLPFYAVTTADSCSSLSLWEWRLCDQSWQTCTEDWWAEGWLLLSCVLHVRGLHRLVLHIGSCDFLSHAQESYLKIHLEGWRASCCELLSNSSSRSRGWDWQDCVPSQRCWGVHWLVLRAWSNHKALMGCVEKGQPGSTGWCSLISFLWVLRPQLSLKSLSVEGRCFGSVCSQRRNSVWLRKYREQGFVWLSLHLCEHSSLMGLWAPQWTSQGGQDHICCSLCLGVFCLFRLPQEITLCEAVFSLWEWWMCRRSRSSPVVPLWDSTIRSAIKCNAWKQLE